MELQLGLALPSTASGSPVGTGSTTAGHLGFDLNSRAFYCDEAAPPCSSHHRRRHHMPARTLTLLPELDCSSESESYPNHQNYVKVTMDGVGIGRKVDLGLHCSFETLHCTLMGMFGICNEESKDYELNFQDAQGDWFRADHDVITWRAFLMSVQRLRIVKLELIN